jgi:hypothetical protein
MGRKELRGLGAAGFRHVVPEFDALVGIETRFRHQVEADQVGLAFVGAT